MDILVEVRLFATLRELLLPETRGVTKLSLPAHSSIDDLLEKVGSLDRRTLILMVNGRRVKDFSVTLNSGDRVALFPPVGGG